MKVLQVLQRSLKDHITAICVALLLAIFAGSAVWLALRLGPIVVPDESTHYAISKIFSTTWGIPPDTVENMRYGPVHHSPFVFYWIDGRILNLLTWLAPFMTDRAMLVALRFLGVAYSSLAIVFAYLGAGEILKNRWAQLMVVFLLTATAMYVMISSGDSYDNLTNLCSFAAFYFLMRVFNGHRFWENSLAWLLIIGIGTLVKITVLPLAGIMGLLWLGYIVKCRREIDFTVKRDVKTIALIALTGAVLLVSSRFYGANLVRYGHLLPACTQVLKKKDCTVYAQYVRDQQELLSVKAGVTDILHGTYPDPAGYVIDFWSSWMLGGIYGLLTHQGLFWPEAFVINGYRLLILATVLITVRYWQKPSYAVAALYIIGLGYILVLLVDNYNVELAYGFRHAGVQGRYVFPVIGALYTSMVYAFMQIPNRIFRVSMFAVTAALFLINSPVAFFLRFYSALVPKIFS